MKTHSFKIDIGFEQILSIFSQLDKNEKHKLFDFLQDDIYEYFNDIEKSLVLTDKQRQELERREKLLQNGEMKTYEWDDIKAKYGL